MGPEIEGRGVEAEAHAQVDLSQGLYAAPSRRQGDAEEHAGVGIVGTRVYSIFVTGAGRLGGRGD